MCVYANQSPHWIQIRLNCLNWQFTMIWWVKMRFFGARIWRMYVNACTLIVYMYIFSEYLLTKTDNVLMLCLYGFYALMYCKIYGAFSYIWSQSFKKFSSVISSDEMTHEKRKQWEGCTIAQWVVLNTNEPLVHALRNDLFRTHCPCDWIWKVIYYLAVHKLHAIWRGFDMLLNSNIPRKALFSKAS